LVFAATVLELPAGGERTISTLTPVDTDAAAAAAAAAPEPEPPELYDAAVDCVGRIIAVHATPAV